jgi:predicted RNA-binding protein associated with RNAse of E/G family
MTGVMSLKRKRADRPDWRRVVQRDFHVKRMKTPTFQGMVTWLWIHRVTSPLVKTMGGHRLVLADDGYLWTQHFPECEKYVLTTMWNGRGEIVQFYVDICLRHGTDSKGVPWYDDLYLDLVLLPSGEWFVLDEDELDEAVQSGMVGREEADIAREEMNRLTGSLQSYERLWKNWADEWK